MTVCMVTRETNLNPNLRPLSKGPYYAMPIYPGDIGTNGGLLTNDKAQVIKKNGKPIEGLYAVGTMRHLQWGELSRRRGDNWSSFDIRVHSCPAYVWRK